MTHTVVPAGTTKPSTGSTSYSSSTDRGPVPPAGPAVGSNTSQSSPREGPQPPVSGSTDSTDPQQQGTTVAADITAADRGGGVDTTSSGESSSTTTADMARPDGENGEERTVENQPVQVCVFITEV